MNIVILSGGYGTRLQSVVRDVPKPMAEIDGTPFLELLMREFAFLDPESFILCVSYKKEIIKDYFKDHFLGIPVLYSEENEPLGTGGAIKQAFEKFCLKDALVINGDSYIAADYNSFLKQAQNEKLSILLKQVDNANRYGRVETKGRHIISFHEKENRVQSGLINAGIYYIKQEIFDQNFPKKFSFEKDLLEQRISQLKPTYMQTEDYFIDIGLPESYAQAQKELKSVIYGKPINKALFLDRDGVINEDIHYLHKSEDCVFMPGIFDFCRYYQDKGYKLIVITNQAGIAKGRFFEKDYKKLRNFIHEEFRKQGCPLDDEYYCPYHKNGNPPYNRSSFFRKPNPGMILLAAKEHNIDLSRSVLIGDNENDILAAKTAGVGQTIRFINPLNMRGSKETIANKIINYLTMKGVSL